MNSVTICGDDLSDESSSCLHVRDFVGQIGAGKAVHKQYEARATRGEFRVMIMNAANSYPVVPHAKDLFDRGAAANSSPVVLATKNSFSQEVPMKFAEDQPDLSQDLLLLSLQMIADELDDTSLEYQVYHLSNHPQFRGVQIYCGQSDLSQDQLYVVQREYYSLFPADQYPYITTGDLPGDAPHIFGIRCSFNALLNFLMNVFQKYHDYEAELNTLVSGKGTLDDLCRVSSSFFQNPMYIHDRYFSILALPYRIQGMLEFNYNEDTGSYNIPLQLIEDFKFNQQYIESLAKRHAAIWGTEQYPLGMRSLYVNLWNGDDYRGRLLINELNTSLKPGQFPLAEFLGRRIVWLLRKNDMRTDYHYRGHEDTLKSLLFANTANPSDVNALLASLSWSVNDEYLAVCMQYQNADPSITSENLVRSDLMRVFRNSICFLHEHRLCLILNLTYLQAKAGDIRHAISPMVRDSLMYGGMSYPICGFYNLPHAFVQASVALDYISTWHDDRWILSFRSCAMNYLYDSIDIRLPEKFVASNELQILKDYDQREGTEYYPTLRSYLLHERSIPHTSADLIIHRTTLLYRLDKIKKIVHLHLDDADTRLYLLISFKILDRK